MRVFFQERSLVFLLACVLAVAGAARAEVVELHADLDGICAASGSPATGTGTFTLDTTTGLFEWEIVHSNFSSSEFNAHVHGPLASPCGLQADAKVIVFLSSGSPKIGSETLTEQQQQDLLDGLFYVNIHTDDFTPGEIKGKIEVVQPPVPTASLWGLITLALAVLTGGTIGIRISRNLSA
ncbi:MAG: CHRD domain-containing protein [Planctomycetes bacterium]|nr:CHRD domain-containing protein [Planctomycetota bacterium]